VQISYIVCNRVYSNPNLLDFIIKRDNFNIHNADIHGITDLISDERGISFLEMATSFYKNLLYVDTIIIHNAQFDLSVLKSELYRYNLGYIILELESKIVICSMKSLTNFVGIKGKYGFKYPTLAELYKKVFDEAPEISLHNSKNDVLTLFKIFKFLYDNDEYKAIKL
jgi:DNA polymerase III epsilon subunit-like protein